MVNIKEIDEIWSQIIKQLKNLNITSPQDSTTFFQV